MNLYRISKAEYSLDLTGHGAELYGGRWNSIGTKVVYTSTSESLALVESLAWSTMSQLISAGFVLIVISCPDHSLKEFTRSELPEGWDKLDAYPKTQKIGDAWLKESSTLLLRLPSALVPREFNVLVNPSHPLMSEVQIEETFDIIMDIRLIENRYK